MKSSINKRVLFFRRLILLYMLLGLPNGLQAQVTTTVQGTIHDKDSTSIKLESVKVQGINLNDFSTLFTTYSNENGFYQYEIVTTNVDDPNSIPLNFELSQNYPNPFNPSTRFNFHVPLNGKYNFEIFDVTGSTLYKKSFDLTPGNYTIDISGLGPAGVKFLRISSKDFVEVKKMIQLDGSFFDPKVNLINGNSFSINKVTNLNIRIIASKPGYLEDSVDVSYQVGGTYNQDFELRKKKPIYFLSARIDVYNTKGDVVTNLDYMKFIWPDGTSENVPINNGVIILNKSFYYLNEDTTAFVKPDHPDLYLNWVIGTTKNPEKVEWLYQNKTPWSTNNAKIPLNKINNRITEQYIIPKFVNYGVNNDQPIDMAGPEVTTVLSRPPSGIVTGFRPYPYDTTYVFQLTFDYTRGDTISKSNLDRAYNELRKILDGMIWPHKKLLLYQYHVVESFEDSLWQFVTNGPRNWDNFTYMECHIGYTAFNGVQISLDGSYRISWSHSIYGTINTNSQILDEIFDTFCNTNIDVPAHIAAIYIAGMPLTDLGHHLIGIAYIMKPRTDYWDQ